MSRLMAFAALGVLIGIVDGGKSNAQAPAATRHAFEVATIKPTDPDDTHLRISIPGNQVSAEGFTVKDMVAFAYQVDRSQVVSGPKWIGSDRYDILGKPETAGKPALDEVRLMLQALLADRWQLSIHRETREMPVLVLTIGKDGPKMKLRTEGDGGEATKMVFQGAKLPGRYVSMKQLAELLQGFVFDRPVLDKTGLAGNFDFNLAWRPEADQFRGKGGSMESDPNDPDIFAAVQEQLGLKLESQKGPAEVIVIDSVERPSEN